MLRSPSRRAWLVAGAVALVGACSGDGTDGDLATWCNAVERLFIGVNAIDADAYSAGDPEAIEQANALEEVFDEAREVDPPAEIRDTFERAIDPAGYQADAPPEYAEARDEVEVYLRANCDLPDELLE